MSEKTNRKTSETDGERLDALLSALGEVAPDTEDDIDSFLKSCGYDLQELNKRSNSLLAKLLGESPEPKCNRAAPEMEQPVQNELRHVAKRPLARKDHILAIMVLQEHYGVDVGAYPSLRNLDDLRDDELKDIREELESLRSDGEASPPENK